jgi:hypothetical protein
MMWYYYPPVPLDLISVDDFGFDARLQGSNLTNSDTLRPVLVDPIVDAVVFVAIGPVASSPILGWSVSSVVGAGKWDGAIYVLTDQPGSVRSMVAPEVKSNNLNILEVEMGLAMPWSLHSFNAKLVKCRLLELLPKTIRSAVYIDSDIMVGRPLKSFWENLERIWNAGKGDVTCVALFEDSKAFTAGFCTDCDTWNSGVMSIVRGKSESCLNRWCERLAATGGTDQAALSRVIAEGDHCQNIVAFDRGHVRMMRDFFVVAGLVGTKTFNHFTGLFRPYNLSPLHLRHYESALGKSLLGTKASIRR